MSVDDNWGEALRKSAERINPDDKTEYRFRVIDPSNRAHRQLFNHQYAGVAYDDLHLVVNSRGIALTLRDGTLIRHG